MLQKDLNALEDYKLKKIIGEKKLKIKEEIISKFSATLNNVTNNLLLKDPTVALNNNDLVPKTAPSNYNENILPPAGDCSIQQIVKDKDKEEFASISASSIKISTNR